MISLNTQNKLSGSAFAYRFTSALIGAIILFAIGGFLFSLGQITSTDMTTGVSQTSSVPGFIPGIVFILVGIAALIHAVLWYLTFSYTVQDQSVTINSGVLLRQSKTIDFNKIQNVDNSRGPLQMMFGLSSVNIWTAAQDQFQNVGRGGRVVRPDGKLYLSRQDAEDLKAYIAQKGSVQNVQMVSSRV